MIVRTTATGVWLAAICFLAAPSAGFCEVRTLPGAESALAALLPLTSEPADEPGASTLFTQSQVEIPQAAPEAPTGAAADLRDPALNTITAPPESFLRRLLSAVVQLGAAATSR